MNVGERITVSDERGRRVRGSPSHAGRTGVVAKLCGECFAGWVYVRLDPLPRERVEKVVMLPVEDLR